MPCSRLEGASNRIQAWAGGKGTSEVSLQGLRDRASAIVDMCRRLDEYDIPLTLTHGDAALTNATYNPPNSQQVMFFDWEFGHIGHPFCDIHRLHKNVSREVLDDYLELWSGSIDIDRAREALELGCKLGWAIKIWSINPQRRSALYGWATNIMTRNIAVLAGECNDAFQELEGS